ncbi:hypothetical protein ACWELV_10215 [Streptomyces mirabilis]|uniref:hypothetical protein n=1 Tax=Streptomyces mirabilis TaxID=68239 RepID=UPI0033A9D8BB
MANSTVTDTLSNCVGRVWVCVRGRSPAFMGGSPPDWDRLLASAEQRWTRLNGTESEMGVAVVVSTASYWAYSAVWPMKRDAVPGVASVKGLQPVIMERSLKVIDEELQVAGADVPPPQGAHGNAL